MRRTLHVYVLWLAALLCGGSISFGATNTVRVLSVGTNNVRPTKWATKVTATNLSNFYLVTTNLYRGAQPNAKGMAELKTMGIRTVVNLRSYHSDTDELRGLDFKPARIKMQPWHTDEEDVVAFLKVAVDTNNYPIFVHCQRGADRTGLACAMYRIVMCGWTKADAIEEMTDGGFKFDPRWKNIVKYIENADIEAVKRQAGIP